MLHKWVPFQSEGESDRKISNLVLLLFSWGILGLKKQSQMICNKRLPVRAQAFALSVKRKGTTYKNLPKTIIQALSDWRQVGQTNSGSGRESENERKSMAEGENWGDST